MDGHAGDRDNGMFRLAGLFPAAFSQIKFGLIVAASERAMEVGRSRGRAGAGGPGRADAGGGAD
jgi:hypothetical protein